MTSQQVEVKITEISKDGNGLGEAKNGNDTIHCEIPFTLPGDLIKASLYDAGVGLKKGWLQTIVIPSPLRTPPRCSHFTACGGCRLQHIPYRGQLLHKEKTVRDCFSAFLSQGTTLHPIIALKTIWNYRNKMDYTFSYDEKGQCSLGHIHEGLKGGVVNINECHLCPQWFMDALVCIKQWWKSSKISAYDPMQNKGVLRHLTLQEGRRSGDRMVILSVANRTECEFSIRHIEKFVACLAEYVKPHQQNNHLSVFLRLQQAAEEDLSSQYEIPLYGPGFIREGFKIHLNPEKEPVLLQFEVGPSAAFQPNPQQAELLYTRALEMAGLSCEHVVYDLYCGAGALGLCAAAHVKKVIGIELSPEAAATAQANAKLNAYENVSIYSGAREKVLRELQEAQTPLPDLVIVNLPKGEFDKGTLDFLFELNAPVVLYISHSPSNQAKNLAVLLQRGYRLSDLQPIDHSPQTNQVQNIAILRRD